MGEVEENARKLSGMILGIRSDVVHIDIGKLGKDLAAIIEPAAHVRQVLRGDLHVFYKKKAGDDPAAAEEPGSITEAMKYGTRFFDAYVYFSMMPDDRPPVAVGQIDTRDDEAIAAELGKRMAWMALHLMIRGNYPEVDTQEPGKDVPQFLLETFGVQETPRAVSRGLASFPLSKIDPGWIKVIDWGTAGPEIRQRLGLSLAGYRLLGMFKNYRPKSDADRIEKDVFKYVREIAHMPLDYSILSATRQPSLVAKFGPWNKNLTNAILSIFSQADIADAVKHKVLSVMPKPQRNAENWRSWPSIGHGFLKDPVKMDQDDWVRDES